MKLKFSYRLQHGSRGPHACRDVFCNGHKIGWLSPGHKWGTTAHSLPGLPFCLHFFDKGEDGKQTLESFVTRYVTDENFATHAELKKRRSVI